MSTFCFIQFFNKNLVTTPLKDGEDERVEEEPQPPVPVPEPVTEMPPPFAPPTIPEPENIERARQLEESAGTKVIQSKSCFHEIPVQCFFV